MLTYSSSVRLSGRAVHSSGTTKIIGKWMFNIETNAIHGFTYTKHAIMAITNNNKIHICHECKSLNSTAFVNIGSYSYILYVVRSSWSHLLFDVTLWRGCRYPSVRLCDVRVELSGCSSPVCVSFWHQSWPDRLQHTCLRVFVTSALTWQAAAHLSVCLCGIRADPAGSSTLSCLFPPCLPLALYPLKEQRRPQQVCKEKCKKLTAPGIPRRSPIQVLTRPDPA